MNQVHRPQRSVRKDPFPRVPFVIDDETTRARNLGPVCATVAAAVLLPAALLCAVLAAAMLMLTGLL